MDYYDSHNHFLEKRSGELSLAQDATTTNP